MPGTRRRRHALPPLPPAAPLIAAAVPGVPAAG
jgi:hypothetical protein